MDSGLNESKQGNKKEGWRRVLVWVQVMEKIGDEKSGICTPICPWEWEVTS